MNRHFAVEASHPRIWYVSSFILDFFMSIKFYGPRYYQKICKFKLGAFEKYLKDS